MDDSKVQFKRKAIYSGTTVMVSIPPELKDFIALAPEDTIVLQAESGNKGRYISMWRKEKDE